MSTQKQVFSALAVREERGTSREECTFPIAGSLPWGTVQSPGIISPSPAQAICLELVLFISIIIFNTYILAADTYCCLSHRVAPSLMAQSGYLPEPVAEPGLGSTAGLELQGAQTRQPAAKPHPHRLLQHHN